MGAGLEVQYSKEVAKELSKFAVCLPGDPVGVGDVIFFPFGKSGLFGQKIRPWGAFQRVTTLNALGVQFQTAQHGDPDPYIFASKKSVSIDFKAGGQANVPGGPATAAELDAKFTKEGSVYFAAVGCTREEIVDVSAIEVDLNHHKKDVIWRDTFLVTSVTTAAKALVMQSTSSSGNLSVSGDVRGLQPGAGANVSANAVVSLVRAADASFLKDWSDNVTVFFGLQKFEKSKFGGAGLVGSLEAVKATSDLVHHDDDLWRLVALSPQHYLEESD